jgi:broad specificity phosphatase PhoE
VDFYLVRHGEIEANTQKVYAGRSSSELTERGIGQAKDAGLSLQGKSIDKIFCSPLKRTVQTARIIGDTLQLNPIVEDSFNELLMGSWEGLSEKEVERYYPKEWEIWNNRPAELNMEGRETLAGLLKRVLGGISKLELEDKVGSFVIVTHVAVIRVLRIRGDDGDLNSYKKVNVPNGRIFHMRLINNRLTNVT